MKQVLLEGLNLVQRLARLPFRAARQAISESRWGTGRLGDVVQESVDLGEGLAGLPFRAMSAVVEEMGESRQSLEKRVSAIEERLGPPPKP